MMRCLWPVALRGGLAVALLAGPVDTLAQGDFSQVEIKTTHVAGNVYMLQGAGGNIGVCAGPDGILLVDDEYAPLADKIREALRGIAQGDGQVTEGPIKFVINTHVHEDHTGANVVFGREATIIAHADVRRRLSARQEGRGWAVEPSPPEALPVLTFDDSISIYLNGEEIRAIHLPPGHTDGDCVVFFTAANVAHLGDYLFTGKFPYIGLESGGNVERYKRNVEALLARLPADVQIIPGHGRMSSLDDLRSFQRMLRTTTDLIREKMQAGMPREKIQQEGLPAEWASWGTGFVSAQMWIQIVYTSYAKSAMK